MAKKFTLDKLRQKYNFKGKSLVLLMQKIITINNTKLANFLGQKIKKFFQKKVDKILPQEGKFVLPSLDEMLNRQTIIARKGVLSGIKITNTLKKDINKALKSVILESEQLVSVRGRTTGRLNKNLEKDLIEKLNNVFENYTKKDSKFKIPSNIETIAVTELRSTVNMTKDLYVTRMKEENPDLVVMKKWVHNPHLSKVPRRNHAVVARQQAIPFDENFVFLDVHGKKVSAAYPHDNSLPLHEKIGCHCELDYILKKGKKVRVNKDLYQKMMISVRKMQYKKSV